MRCPSCLCSDSHEIEIETVRYLECDHCGALISPEEDPDRLLTVRYRDVRMLQRKLQETNEMVEKLCHG